MASVERVPRWAGLCRDGLPFILIGATATLLAFFWSWHAAVPIGTLTLLVTWFFRDPERQPPEDPRLILSPADGRVVDVRPMPYPRILEGPSTKVSIFLSPLNVHVNRVPMSGAVQSVNHTPGKFLAAFAEKASLDNEQTAVVVRTDRGLSILFIQIAGFLARRIVCRVSPGDKVERGERYGLIKFGSRMDVYLPPSVEVRAKVGDRVRGGESVLGVQP